MKKWTLVPLVLFLVLSVLFFQALFRENKNDLPSALLNRPLPAFQLPTVLNPERVVTEKDLLGQVSLLNVWGTWCIGCRVEHPFLMELAEQGVTLYGVNYKDEQSDARQWLKLKDDPYVFSAADIDGRLGIDLGVYGAPETFLVDRQGMIRYKHIGVVDKRVWEEELKFRYQALLKESG
ncbi:thiol:disulfide interchange protein [Endozoicomonas montiporae]|uniref:Thiol:disulfide interchange protein n=2 Tax=Endozoicomonas montiporae TaxID=1027273 RepID=A0A081N562_9GAMM|nr:DsbE family thiol:disulfide interchange protein [Endozoicomonas montiporae]AMO57535.1 cytochrome c-type biogenesis protein CcmG [Endozoicomonas montiporae CL-33]KEQ13585.1 thiol:disulfide interchange protein [Endozoicomonas montiporae]